MTRAEDEVIRYYNKTESRLGYDLLLHGTKHFGYYEPGDRAWRLADSLRRMEDRLGTELALPPGSSVLDAGCGVGDVASRLAGKRRLHVTGIDILDFNIDEARRRVRRRDPAGLVDVRLMSYDDLTFPENTFDGVYTMETLVHAADPARVLAGFHRVLRPGGRLVLFEYQRAADEVMPPRARTAFRTINEVAAMPGFDLFTHGTLEAMARSAGFDEVGSTDITDHMLPMLRVFALAGSVPYAVARIVGRPDKVINAMSGVEFWKYRRFWRYDIVKGVKPRP